MCDQDCNRCFNSTCIVDEKYYFYHKQKQKNQKIFNKKKKYFYDYETKKYFEENYERSSNIYEY